MFYTLALIHMRSNTPQLVLDDLNQVDRKVKFECVYVNSIHDKSNVT